MNGLQIILSIPAAVDWQEVPQVFADAGYTMQLPASGVMPASKQAQSRVLLHAVILGATYQEVLDLIADQRPTYQVFGCIGLHEIPNPAYTDPEIPETIEVDGETVANPAYIKPTMVEVFEPLNASVWNFIPDRKIYDGDGNEVGSVPVTKLHSFQGCASFSERG